MSSSHSSESSESGVSSDSDDADDSKRGNETPEDENIVHDDTAQQVKVAGRDDNRTSDSEDPSSVSNQAEGSTNSAFSLGNIVTHVESLNEHGVTFGGMTGKDIKTVLGLITTSNLKKTDHKNTFAASNRIK